MKNICMSVSWACLVLCAACAVAGEDAPTRLTTEYCENPLGLDTDAPRFGWWMAGSDRDLAQSAYHLLVASSMEVLAADRGDVWDSGEVASDRSVHVLYKGSPLSSFTRYYWKVRTWDAGKRVSTWSEPAWFETALMTPADFTAQWIRPQDGLADSYGYRSAPQRKAKAKQWVEIDFAEPQMVAAVVLYPARAEGSTGSDPALGFPVRYRIELADAPEAKRPLVLADRTQTDQPNPVRERVEIEFTPQTGRYLRLTATQLPGAKSSGFCLALAEVAVLDEAGRNVAQGKAVTASSSDESSPWGAARLTDGIERSEKRSSVSPLLRKAFSVTKPVLRARAYVSGMGYYELYLNGRRVGDHVLDPGNTVEAKRKLYSVYDVTDLIADGPNVAGMMLGHGWHSGPCAAWLELRLEHAGGSVTTLVTDTSWRAAAGPIVKETFFNGESYDARLERPGWLLPGYDDAAWGATAVYEKPPERVACQTIPPIRVVGAQPPEKITQLPTGEYVVDFGWNLTGWVRLKVTGRQGTEVVLRHAELLYPDGSLNTENLGTAKATDTYILKGGGEEVYEPRFTQHGFRYVSVAGYPGALTPGAIEAQIVHTDLKTIGAFTCSSPLYNKIDELSLRSILGNSMSIPTDCPQRSERMGWMADAHLIAEATINNFDAAAYYESWLQSIADAQDAEGHIPDTVPYYKFGELDGSPPWAVAYPLLTWYLYRYYDDTRAVEQHYPNIVRWFKTLEAKADHHLLRKCMYGDWVGVEGTPGDIISTGVYYLTAKILAEFAQALGKPDEAAAFQTHMAEIAAAFNANLFDAAKGCYGDGSQFSQVWPLYLGIVPEDRVAAVLAHLRSEIVEHRQGHLATGILGTKYLFDVLSDSGNVDLAYRVSLQEDYPSWGYMIANGATTLWELWKLETGKGMNSHNHQMYGSIVGWFFDNVAGINALPEPGYDRFTLAPLVTNDLDSAAAHMDTVHGRVACRWERRGGAFSMTVEIPPNTRARVVVPTLGKVHPKVLLDGRPAPAGKRGLEGIAYDLGSGTYQWEVR